MKLKCISTGSHGNGYILVDNNNNSLIIEAGVKLKRVKEYLEFNLTNVLGVVLSHTHL